MAYFKAILENVDGTTEEKHNHNSRSWGRNSNLTPPPPHVRSKVKATPHAASCSCAERHAAHEDLARAFIDVSRTL
jgi:hypothetical protein